MVTISLVSKQVGRGTHTLQVYNFQTDLRIFFFVAVTWKFYQLSEDPKCKSHPQIIELSLEPTKNPFFCTKFLGPIFIGMGGRGGLTKWSGFGDD